MRTEGGIWSAQYVIISVLSIYLVMQTIEAVLFRVIELSLPIWLVWGVARPSSRPVILAYETRVALTANSEVA